jgi:hypothetical protein
VLHGYSLNVMQIIEEDPRVYALSGEGLLKDVPVIGKNRELERRIPGEGAGEKKRIKDIAHIMSGQGSPKTLGPQRSARGSGLYSDFVEEEIDRIERIISILEQRLQTRKLFPDGKRSGERSSKDGIEQRTEIEDAWPAAEEEILKELDYLYYSFPEGASPAVHRRDFLVRLHASAGGFLTLWKRELGRANSR